MTLRAVSPKRRAKLKTRAQVVARVHERDRACQAAGLLEGPCAGPLDAHEIIPRSAWPAGWLEESNVILVCRSCHDWIGGHPELAHGLGLHGFSWDRPDGHCGGDAA